MSFESFYHRMDEWWTCDCCVVNSSTRRIIEKCNGEMVELWNREIIESWIGGFSSRGIVEWWNAGVC